MNQRLVNGYENLLDAALPLDNDDYVTIQRFVIGCENLDVVLALDNNHHVTIQRFVIGYENLLDVVLALESGDLVKSQKLLIGYENLAVVDILLGQTVGTEDFWTDDDLVHR